MTRDQLQACTKDKLIELARRCHVVGWHGMRKDDLIKVLARELRRRREGRPAALRPLRPPRAVRRRPQHLRGSQPRRRRRNAANTTWACQPATSRPRRPGPAGGLRQGPHRRDGARPVLAALLLGADAPRHPAGRGRPRPGMAPGQADPAHPRREQPRHDQHVRNAAARHRHPRRLQQLVHRRRDPPTSYRIDIGYLAESGRFYVLARSNVVTTPRAGVSDVIDENWADIDAKKADRIYAMSGGFDPSGVGSSLELKQLFEERLRRPLHSPAITSFGSGGLMPGGTDAAVLVPAGRRADHLRRHRAERPRHLAGRAGEAPQRRHLHDALQPARRPADHPRRRHLA